MLGLQSATELIGNVKDLCREDLELFEKAGSGKAVRDFKVVRDKHHRIAQLFALGQKSGEIAARMDMSPSTISTLRHSPAMDALVEQYREEAFSSDLGVNGKIEEVAIDGLRELHIRIMTGELGDKELVTLTTGLFDRTGRGPTKKVEKRNVSLTGSELIELKKMAREAENFRPHLGERVITIVETEKVQGSDSEGDLLREEDDSEDSPTLSLVPSPIQSMD